MLTTIILLSILLLISIIVAVNFYMSQEILKGQIKWNKANDVANVCSWISTVLRTYETYENNLNSLRNNRKLHSRLLLQTCGNDEMPLVLYYIHFIRDCKTFEQQGKELDLQNEQLSDYIKQCIFINYYDKGYPLYNIEKCVKLYLDGNYKEILEKRELNWNRILENHILTLEDAQVTKLMLDVYPIKQGSNNA